jgi:hypothetical protein
MNTIIKRAALTTCALALVVTGGLAIAADDDAPTGSIIIKETQVGFLIGGDWGHGTLTFDGETHMFHMGGGKLGGIGVTVADVTGDVYHLTNIKDFNGTYFKAEAGATLVKGRIGSWVKNSNGVSIHLVQKTEGAAISIGVEGLRIELN